MKSEDIFVCKVHEGSVADKCEVKAGFQLIEINGIRITSLDHVKSLMENDSSKWLNLKFISDGNFKYNSFKRDSEIGIVFKSVATETNKDSNSTLQIDEASMSVEQLLKYKALKIGYLAPIMLWLFLWFVGAHRIYLSQLNYAIILLCIHFALIFSLSSYLDIVLSIAIVGVFDLIQMLLYISEKNRLIKTKIINESSNAH